MAYDIESSTTGGSAGPVGPEPTGPVSPGVADAPAVAHNPVATQFAHPAAIHNPIIRVISKIASAATSPGIINAAHGLVQGLANTAQAAEEGARPAVGANVVKAQVAPSAIQKNVAQAGEATAGAALKGAQETTEEKKPALVEAQTKKAGAGPT